MRNSSNPFRSPSGIPKKHQPKQKKPKVLMINLEGGGQIIHSFDPEIGAKLRQLPGAREIPSDAIPQHLLNLIDNPLA